LENDYLTRLIFYFCSHLALNIISTFKLGGVTISGKSTQKNGQRLLGKGIKNLTSLSQILDKPKSTALGMFSLPLLVAGLTRWPSARIVFCLRISFARFKRFWKDFNVIPSPNGGYETVFGSFLAERNTPFEKLGRNSCHFTQKHKILPIHRGAWKIYRPFALNWGKEATDFWFRKGFIEQMGGGRNGSLCSYLKKLLLNFRICDKKGHFLLIHFFWIFSRFVKKGGEGEF